MAVKLKKQTKRYTQSKHAIAMEEGKNGYWTVGRIGHTNVEVKV